MLYHNAVDAAKVAVKLYNDLLGRAAEREVNGEGFLERLVQVESLMDHFTDTPGNPERIKRRLMGNKYVLKLMNAINTYRENHNLIDFFREAGSLTNKVYGSLISNSFATSVFQEPDNDEYKRLKDQVGIGSAKATWYHKLLTDALRPQPQPALATV